MLQEMNINPQDILPTEDRIREEILISDYKVLTEKEIIRIQKFFIKKLIEKISKWFTVFLSVLLCSQSNWLIFWFQGYLMIVEA